VGECQFVAVKFVLYCGDRLAGNPAKNFNAVQKKLSFYGKDESVKSVTFVKSPRPPVG
jgi:hypothetical protein